MSSALFHISREYITREEEKWVAMYKKELSKGHHLYEDEHAIYVKTVYGKQFLTHGMFNRWLDDPGKPIHWMSGKPPELDEE